MQGITDAWVAMLFGKQEIPPQCEDCMYTYLDPDCLRVEYVCSTEHVEEEEE